MTVCSIFIVAIIFARCGIPALVALNRNRPENELIERGFRRLLRPVFDGRRVLRAELNLSRYCLCSGSRRRKLGSKRIPLIELRFFDMEHDSLFILFVEVVVSGFDRLELLDFVEQIACDLVAVRLKPLDFILRNIGKAFKVLYNLFACFGEVHCL